MTVDVYPGGVNTDTPTSLGAADFIFGAVRSLCLIQLFVLQVPESEKWRPNSATHGRRPRIYCMPSVIVQLCVLQGPWVAVQG